MSNKVLIVEDEKILAGNLLALVQRCGWEARVASTGKAALRSSVEFMPQLILLDYHLSDMNGFQVLDALRAMSMSCRCILMTGLPTAEMMSNMSCYGIPHVLFKPFSLADMEFCLAFAASRIASIPPPEPQPRGNPVGQASASEQGAWLNAHGNWRAIRCNQPIAVRCRNVGERFR